MFVHECVSVPCLHLFQCAGFIVSERVFDKGLEGFKMNLVSVVFCSLFDFSVRAEDND